MTTLHDISDEFNKTEFRNEVNNTESFHTPEELIKQLEREVYIITNDNESHKKIVSSIKDFPVIFEACYNIYERKKLYWQYCTLETFKLTFEDRCKEFVKTNTGAIRKDFIEKEIDSIKIITDNGFKYVLPNGKTLLLKDYLFDFVFEKIGYTPKRKLEYLTVELQNPDSMIEVLPPKPKYPDYIFVSNSAYEMFVEFIKGVQVGQKTISFLFHYMKNDGLIKTNIDGGIFRNWFCDDKDKDFDVDVSFERLISKTKAEKNSEDRISRYKLLTDKYNF